MYTHVEARDIETTLLAIVCALMVTSALTASTSIVLTGLHGIQCPKWHIPATQKEWHVPIWETVTTPQESVHVDLVMMAALAKDLHARRGRCFESIPTQRTPLASSLAP